MSNDYSFTFVQIHTMIVVRSFLTDVTLLSSNPDVKSCASDSRQETICYVIDESTPPKPKPNSGRCDLGAKFLAGSHRTFSGWAWVFVDSHHASVTRQLRLFFTDTRCELQAQDHQKHQLISLYRSHRKYEAPRHGTNHFFLRNNYRNTDLAQARSLSYLEREHQDTEARSRGWFSTSHDSYESKLKH